MLDPDRYRPGPNAPKATPEDIAGAKARAEESALAQKAADSRRRLEEFINHLNAPLDMNDPYTKMIAQGASNMASDEARRRGINGGLSVTNVGRGVAGALTGLDMQRKELGLRAMGEGFRVEDADRAYNENNKRYAADQADAYALREYENKQKSGSSLGSLIGGGLGAAGGFLVGGPAGAAAGWSGGSALGGYVGGGLAGGNSPAPRSSYVPSTRSGY